MTTAVWFTLDGTLVSYDADEERIVETALATVFDEEAESLVDVYLDTYREQAQALKPDPHRAGMVAVCEATDADAEPDALVAALREAELDAARVPDAARSALATLADDLHLGVITDAPADWQRAKVDALDLPIETVVSAVAAGARKPDPAPFELARDRIDADEHVMIGDDYERDVEGARGAGFVPIHYEGAAEERPGFWATLDALV